MVATRIGGVVATTHDVCLPRGLYAHAGVLKVQYSFVYVQYICIDYILMKCIAREISHIHTVGTCFVGYLYFNKKIALAK